jgi:hypothetical protein
MKKEIFEILQKGNALQMVCSTDFSIANAQVIKKCLLMSVTRTGDEVLSLCEATSIDLTGIQLAFAWKQILKQQNRRGTVLLPEKEGIKDLLQKTGITEIF